MSDSPRPRILPMLLIAGALTLVVTVVRLIGELNHWDPWWFRTEAGSPGAPFGIIWLVPVFGFLFGRRLAQAGGAPRFVTAFFVPMFGVAAVLFAAYWIERHLVDDDLREGVRYLSYGAPIVALLALFAWPRAFGALLVYAVLARLPVVLIQYLDVQNGWQTHYGRVREPFAGLAADERIWLLTSAQLGMWIPFTILLGCGAAAVGAATARSR